MFVQKAFCHNWHRHLPTSISKNCLYGRLLHHPKGTLLEIAAQNTKSKYTVRHSAARARLQTTPFDHFHAGGPISNSNVGKAVLFTGGFTLSCFVGATIWEYENARSTMLEKARTAKFPWFRNKNRESFNRWDAIKQECQTYWSKLTSGEKMFVPICVLNLIVFGMWRVPSLKNTMLTYFCSNPAARVVCWPMFLSTFSHYSLFHIFANMYVLHSFSNVAVLSLGKEQFLAVYLSAGVISSLSSIFYKSLTSQAGLSLGASGAIMAVLAYVCSQYPDTQLSILFLPMFSFSAGAAIKCIMGLDLVGCIMGWKIFDHAAHLGGALFGTFWAFYGQEVWQKRMTLLGIYHDWRKAK